MLESDAKSFYFNLVICSLQEDSFFVSDSVPAVKSALTLISRCSNPTEGQKKTSARRVPLGTSCVTFLKQDKWWCKPIRCQEKTPRNTMQRYDRITPLQCHLGWGSYTCLRCRQALEPARYLGEKKRFQCAQQNNTCKITLVMSYSPSYPYRIPGAIDSTPLGCFKKPLF